jgi:hypothetical protein
MDYQILYPNKSVYIPAFSVVYVTRLLTKLISSCLGNNLFYNCQSLDKKENVFLFLEKMMFSVFFLLKLPKIQKTKINIIEKCLFFDQLHLVV